MRHILIYVFLLLSGTLCFSQQNYNVRTIGRIPDAGDSRTYQIQVGAFKNYQNAERVFERLKNASFNPAYEKYLDFTRVVIGGIAARDVPFYLQRVQNIGFSEVIIRIDTKGQTASNAPVIAQLPVSTAAVPSPSLSEIGYRMIRIGETINLTEIAGDRNVTSWISSTPSVVSVDSNGSITGQNIGNAYIRINQNEYISIVIVPREDFYIVPDSQVAMLPRESNTGRLTVANMTEYKTEPTFRLSYRFNNKGENKGASGRNGGIDIIARGVNYQWVWTTYYQGGWFYDLNGVKREMINGFQKDANNGVELTVKPEFIYDKGIPYLQLIHKLYNPNNFTVMGQKFGASADVMIYLNDEASLIHTPYGAYMTDSANKPTVELMFVCETGNNITPVDTLWLGTWSLGMHLDYIYTDARNDVHGKDSAIGFSYQKIDLAPGETKEFVVRFTLARN